MRKVMFDINRKYVISSYKAGPEYLISSSFVFFASLNAYMSFRVMTRGYRSGRLS